MLKTALHKDNGKMKHIKVKVALMPAAEARAKLVLAEDQLKVIKKNAWYIENALRVRLDQMKKEVKDGRATLAGPHNDHSAIYRSLEGMCNHVDGTIRDFQKAYDELVAAGVK
jgi:hypothetical protein